MANTREKGKVLKQNINGTIFDVRQVPKYSTDGKTGKRRMETSSICLFVGKNNVKSGFKNPEEAGAFAVANAAKYNKKKRLFV